MSAAKELLTAYQHVISELKLITGGDGVFEVTINGELVFSKHACEDRFPRPGELTEAFTKIAGFDVKQFGT